MRHEEKGSQVLAGWYHVGFAVLYLVALIWHFEGAHEHFSEARKCK
jgi:hypothetical protein